MSHVNILGEASARTITVNNTTPTWITSPVDQARMVQVYVPPSGTAQAFTITLLDGTTIELPANADYQLSTVHGVGINERVFQIQTATGSTVLQVLGHRMP